MNTLDKRHVIKEGLNEKDIKVVEILTNDQYDQGVNVVLLQGITLNYMYFTD